MNLLLASMVNFGDTDALQHFFLDHRTVHEQTAQALTAKTGQAFSTLGIFDALAEERWLAIMRRQVTEASRPLLDWLILHSQIHQNTVAILTGVPIAIDLSEVDFSRPEQFYDWMYVHQDVHTYEQQQLGIS